MTYTQVIFKLSKSQELTKNIVDVPQKSKKLGFKNIAPNSYVYAILLKKLKTKLSKHNMNLKLKNNKLVKAKKQNLTLTSDLTHYNIGKIKMKTQEMLWQSAQLPNNRKKGLPHENTKRSTMMYILMEIPRKIVQKETKISLVNIIDIIVIQHSNTPDETPHSMS